MNSDVTSAAYSMKAGKFRLQNQRLVLTYPGHLDKEEYESWIRSKFSEKYSPVFIRLAIESSDAATPFAHTHVLIDWAQAFKSQNSSILDYGNATPRIKIINTPTRWSLAMQFMSKEDTGNADLHPNSGTEYVTYSYTLPSECLVLTAANDLASVCRCVGLAFDNPEVLSAVKNAGFKSALEKLILENMQPTQ